MTRESYGDWVARMFNKVQDHMLWDAKKTNDWFLARSPMLGGISPNDFLCDHPDKFEKWLDNLIEGNIP